MEENNKEEVKKKKILEIYRLTAPDLEVELVTNFLSLNTAHKFYHLIDSSLEWNRTKSGNIFQRRLAHIFGDPGLVYHTAVPDYKGGNIDLIRHAKGWPEPLLYLRDKVSSYTGEKYNFCVVQRYPTGKVGIQPHRDKEVPYGTSICGLSLGPSLGATRRIEFSRGDWIQSLTLHPGSLYIMKPPTNDVWTHSIPKEENCQEVRLSLTFRTMKNLKS